MGERGQPGGLGIWWAQVLEEAIHGLWVSAGEQALGPGMFSVNAGLKQLPIWFQYIANFKAGTRSLQGQGVHEVPS